MSLRVLLAHIMHIVCRYKGDPRFLMNPDHIRQNLLFFFQTLILQFQIKIFLPEDFPQSQSFLLRSFIVPI